MSWTSHSSNVELTISDAESSSWLHSRAEVIPIRTSTSLDDSGGSTIGPSNLGRKVFHSSELDIESATASINPDIPSLVDKTENPFEVKTEPDESDYAEMQQGVDLLFASKRQAPIRRKTKRKVPDSPGSTLSTHESLESIKQRIHISKGVEFVLSSLSDRADAPPPGHFTFYESFFNLFFL